MASSLGTKIRDLRKAKGLTLEQLADQTESSKGYIWELENRDTRKPSAEKLLKVATVLGVTTEFLLDDGQETPSDDVFKKAFFRKFEKLTTEDQARVMKIVESWGDSQK